MLCPAQLCRFHTCSRLSALELALKQTGSESAKRAADVANRAAVTEGSNAGIVKVGGMGGVGGTWSGSAPYEPPTVLVCAALPSSLS